MSESFMKTSTDAQLVKLIQAGDSIETARGIYRAIGGMSERKGTCYYHAVVPCEVRQFVMPIESYSVLAVWRNGLEIWRKGVIPVQLEMF